MVGINIFENDAFSAVQLTAALDKVDYQPQFLGSLGIFDPVPVRTKTVAVEKRDNKLRLIQTSERGAPLEERENEKRDIRDFRTVRIAKGDTIYADELQDIRAFGSMSELQAVQQEVARRYNGPGGIVPDMELTWEHMRLGAIQGIVLDADGQTVIKNWYQEWGISQPAEIDFALGTEATDVRKKCAQVVRAMRRNAKGSWTGQTRVHALVGDNFYDALINHPQVRETYKFWSAAEDLRTGSAFESFTYGGITFHNYQGTDDEDKVHVGTDKAKFFPVGAAGVFQVAYSPAEFMPFVNAPGQPLYGMMIPDRDRQAWVRQEAYSYPLFMCLRPEMLQRAKRA